MVHGHEHTRTRVVRHRDCLFGSAVIADPRIVSPDRHDGRLEGTKAAMRSEGAGLGGVSPNQQFVPFALHDEPGIAALHVAPETCAPVIDLDRTDESVS